MTQHAELSPERWSRFDLGRQIIQIGAEMQRASECLRADRLDALRLSYERVLRLVDLTVEVNSVRNLRAELLRWRQVIAELYVGDAPDPETHHTALRSLLWLHPLAAEQVQFLTK